MNRPKWFVLPRLYPFNGFDVVYRGLLGYVWDNGLYDDRQSAQARADQLNEGEGK